MKRILVLVMWSLLAVALMPKRAVTQEDEGRAARRFAAVLTGPQETPAILSGATGTFTAHLNPDGTSVHYVLHYEGFAANRTVFVAHIHVGQRGQAGSVTVFFCGGGGRPDCTSPDGTFEADFSAADVMGIMGQDLDPGDFDKVLAAMRAGLTYCNVHTRGTPPDMGHPGGEIRGQILPRRHREEE
jgi:hypothetical protein